MNPRTLQTLRRLLISLLPLLLLPGCSCDDSSTCPEQPEPPCIFPGMVVHADSSAIFVDLHVDPRGHHTLCDCVYGTAQSLLQTSAPVDVGDGYGPRAARLLLSDADFDQQYLFQCRAFSDAGTTSTLIDSFFVESPNELPQTTLSYSPDGGDTTGVRFRLNWFGWDPDGWIDHFDTRIEVDFVPGEWVSVVNTDTVFVLGPEVSVYWMFAVRAVDNRGAADPTPETVVLIPDEWQIGDSRPPRP